MRNRLLRFAACTTALLTLALVAQANPRYRRAFLAKYPKAEGTKLAECTTCHRSVSQMPAINPYGAAFKAAHYTFDDLEKLDSDKDGVSNLAEITALTYPGDPTDKPGVKRAGAKPDSSAAADSVKARPAVPDSAASDTSTTAPPDSTKN